VSPRPPGSDARRSEGREGAVPWTRWRRAVQALSALLWLALPVLADPRATGSAVALRAGPLDLVEPAAALSTALAARALPAALLLGVLPLLALAVILGPVACAWACPYGLVSEGIDAVLSRDGPGWPARGQAATPRPRLAVLLALLALSALLGAPVAAILSPPRLLSVLPLEAWSSRAVPWVTATLLVLLLALELLGPRRLVCRVLCPARTVAALLRRPFTWGPRFTAGTCRCPDLPACATACPWGIDPRDGRLRAQGCTSCMACVERCPTAALVALRRP
jgi:ferredoxin-type protein NapH